MKKLSIFVAVILIGFTGYVHGKTTDFNDMLKSAQRSDPNAQLLEAIKNLDINAVKSALEAGANANFSFLEKGKKCSALRLSILSVKTRENYKQSRSEDVKCKEILTLLTNKGARLQYHDQDVLYHAVCLSLPQVTKLLLELGADASLEVYYKKPIELAVERSNNEIIALLVKHGAQKVTEKEALQLRFIYLASLTPEFDQCIDPVHYTHPVIEMQDILDKGIDINMANRAGERALHCAFDFLPVVSKYSTVVFLLENGANPNLLARERATEKFNTVFHRFVFYSGLLIDEAKAFQTPQSLTEVKLFLSTLVKNGANISLPDSDGQTPLHVAVEFNNLELAKSLITAGVNLDIKDKDGKTPSDYAQSAEMIKLFKAHGAKRNTLVPKPAARPRRDPLDVLLCRIIAGRTLCRGA